MNKTNRIRLLSSAALFLTAIILSPSRADASPYPSFTRGETFAIGVTTWGYYPETTSSVADCDLDIPHKIQVVKQAVEKDGMEWVTFKVIPTVALRANECSGDKLVRMRATTAHFMRVNAAKYAVFKADVANILAGKGTIQSRDGVRAGSEIAVRKEHYATLVSPVAHNLKAYREGDGCRLAPNEKIEVLGFLPHPGEFGPQALLKYIGPDTVTDAGRCPTGMIYAEYLDFSSGEYSR